MPSNEDAEDHLCFASALIRCTKPQPALFQAHVALAANDEVAQDFDIEKVQSSDWSICSLPGLWELKP